MRRCKFNVLFFLTLSALVSFAQQNIFFSHVSGIYAQDVLLNVEPLEPAVELYYSFKSDKNWGPELRYREPLLLEALPGEEREYKVKIIGKKDARVLEERSLEYRIDKRKPRAPVVQVLDEDLPEEVVLSFVDRPGERVVYAINDSSIERGQVWDGSILVLSAQNKEEKEYFVNAFSQDEAGNRSATVTFRYSLREYAPKVEILSPAPGSFANHQILFIKSRDIELIQYTLDGSDPLEGGRIYHGPELLNFTGELRLRVAAVPKGKNKKKIEDMVSFQVQPETRPSLSSDVESGVYTRALSARIVKRTDSIVFYTFHETTPGEYDLPVPGKVKIDSLINAQKYAVLRLRALLADGTWGGEYRFFYLIDRRRPQMPLIRLKKQPPLNGPTNFELLSIDQAEIYYTLDGSEPDQKARQYTGSFNLDPDALSGEFPAIKAKTRSLSGLWSETRTLEVPVNRKSPAPPDVSFSAVRAANKPVLISIDPSPGSLPLYEISSQTDGDPVITADSPRADRLMVLNLPYGAGIEFKLRFGSIDPAGNISETRMFRINLDRQPPLCPQLDPLPNSYDRNLTLRMESAARIYYELTSDGAIPKDPTTNSPQYVDALNLTGEENNRTGYYIKLLCQDVLGNLSDVYGPFHYIIDLNQPELPAITGIVDEGFYNSSEVYLRIDKSPTPVFYTYSEDGSEPPEPDEKSTRLDTEWLSFLGKIGAEKHFWVKIVPYSTDLQRRGAAQSLSFTIDMMVPQHAQVEGFENGQRYNKEISASIRTFDVNERVYVSYATSAQALKDPVLHGELYTKPLRFDAEQGVEVEIHLRMATLDRAGNRAPGDLFRSFVIDKKAPQDPEVTIFPVSALSKDSITVTMTSAEGDIYYEMTSDGTLPPLPSGESPLFNTALFFTTRKNQELNIKLIARTVDSLGNFSSGNRIYSMTVDRLPPSPPEEPNIEVIGNTIYISWDTHELEKLYYRIRDREINSTFKLYKTSIVVPRADLTTDMPQVEYYCEDRAGNKSGNLVAALPAAVPALAKPKIEGAADGAIFARGVDLRFSDAPAGSRVHYELTTDGSLPPPVTASSGIAGRVIRLDCNMGETLDIRLRFRAVSDTDKYRSSEEVLLRFTIDKTPPEAPALSGVEADGYYHQNQTLRLFASEGTIYYALIVSDPKPELPELDHFRVYQDAIPLRAPAGEKRSYWIAAYTRDPAGNRSLETEVWHITLDKQVVYVSKQGSDQFDGTRDRPFQSLDRAIEEAIQNGRVLIHSASGWYELDKTISLARSLTIVGGFDPVSWRPGLQPTVFDTSPHFRKNQALIRIASGKVRLEKIEIKDSRNVCSELIRISGGSLSLKNVKINRSNRGGAAFGLRLNSGTLTVTNSVFSADKSTGGILLGVYGGKLTVSGSELVGPSKGDDFTILHLEGNSESRISGTRITTGNGKNIHGVVLKNSSLSLIKSSIQAGRGEGRIAAVNLDNAYLELLDSTLTGDPEGAYSAGLIADSSEVRISNSTIKTAARFGTFALILRRSGLRLEGSTLISSPTAEFQYLLEFQDSEAYIANNVFNGAASGDSVLARINDSRTDWFHNTLIGGTGKNLTFGFILRGDNNTRFVNNILMRQGQKTGTAIYLIGSQDPHFLLQGNNLSGWETLLEISESPTLPSGKTYRRAPQLNMHDNNFAGGPFHKNIDESYERTFVPGETTYHLRSDSACVNGGIDPQSMGGPTVDIDGQARPAPFVGIKPAFDIGADEPY